VSAVDRNRRAELLAAADRASLLEVADACLAGTGQPQLGGPPEVGVVVMTVREPVESTRFHLGEVLVTRSEVEHRGRRGWSMRLGNDRPAALAAAICDAEAEASGPQLDRIDQLCRSTEQRMMAERAGEWDELEPTIVRFEEMGE
jgi:alpha-D-ribose 1-methylphosphonate 5-triphosphate synthase subunit PhnG